jgi:glutathione synthase/RimK-type ligase-like ATP-grasp enzyme
MEHTPWLSRAAQVRRLSQLDNLIAEQPEALDARVERAVLLNATDKRDEAKRALVDVLLQAPAHFRALNELGGLLSSMRHIAAACRVYSEMIRRHPNSPVAHVNIANLLLHGGKLEQARKHYATALRLEPDHPQAHQGLGAVLAAMGNRAAARPHFEAGFIGCSIVTLPYRGAGSPLPMLQLVSSGDGNIPTASFLDDRVFLTNVIVADFCDPSVPLPPHRLVFNAIGDSDLCAPALEGAIRLVSRTNAPIINRPEAVMKTGRAENAGRLGALPHVRTPKITPFSRAILAGPNAASLLLQRGFRFPLLLRSPGFHTGRNFVLLNDAGELPRAVDGLPGDEILAIEYLDARGRDGNVRKYRAMFVDGQIFPLHAAIARQWKVHYFTADMADDSAHRLEDAAFLHDMESVVGPKAMTALARIRDTLGLEYAGIDFGLSASGDVLVFETNATMVVNPPDADERWAYRRPAVDKILDAVKAMFIRMAAPAKMKRAG